MRKTKYKVGDTIYWGSSKCFPGGAARQGLPTSPALSNLACIKMDSKILQICSKKDIIYTRYADDLTFSGDNLAQLKRLKNQVICIVSKKGFDINKDKTRIQSASFGRRQITGVSVGNQGIYPTRKIKRRLRAALHQKNWPEARGLKEWCKLKLPNPQGGCNLTKVQKTWAKHQAIKMIEKGK